MPTDATLLASIPFFTPMDEAERAAVRAGLTLPWSNGQTEGQVNRLKMLKRQMYGRANIDLLRQRVLYRAQHCIESGQDSTSYGVV